MFLQYQSADEIHAKMMDFLPNNLDKSEGQFVWDFTRPTAYEKAEMVEFVLVEAIKSIFPMWSEGTLLDYHAQCRGMVRKAATAAVGSVTVTALEGTVIPKGFKILTPATYEKSGVVFYTNYEVEVKKDPVEIEITAETKGKIGNVASGTITLMDTPIDGVLSIINKESTTGGVDEETDDDLRTRILEYDQQQGVSFVGSLADYYRWCSEVKGVGAVKVYPAEDDTGTVKIIATDANNEPASEELCKAIYDYIMQPDSPSQRKAPVNAVLDVNPPSVKKIVITTTGLRLDVGYGIEQVRSDYMAALNKYFNTPDAEKVILFDKIAGILIQTSGVLEYYDLKMNGAEEDINLTVEEMPVADISGVVAQ